MILLAIDQSTNKNGWAIITDKGVLLGSGMQDFSNAKERYEVRISHVKRWVIKMLQEHRPDVVGIEEVPPTPGKAMTVLSNLFGVLENTLLERGENYLVIPAGTWRADIGLKANLEVTCPECGAKLQRITSAHIWKCSKMNLETFKAKHGKHSLERDERTALKEASMAHVKERFGRECGDDEADAICLALYMLHRINLQQK